MGRHKIFGVGLNKTGTTSLAQAVELLDFRAVHYGGDQLSKVIDHALRDGRPMFSDCDTAVRSADAYFDVSCDPRALRARR